MSLVPGSIPDEDIESAREMVAMLSQILDDNGDEWSYHFEDDSALLLDYIAGSLAHLLKVNQKIGETAPTYEQKQAEQTG